MDAKGIKRALLFRISRRCILPAFDICCETSTEEIEDVTVQRHLRVLFVVVAVCLYFKKPAVQIIMASDGIISGLSICPFSYDY